MSEEAQLKLRVPQELKEFLELEAKSNFRTINGEVVFKLEKIRNDMPRTIHYYDFRYYPHNPNRESFRDHQRNFEEKISDFLEKNPDHFVINIETLELDGKYIVRCWYSKPKNNIEH